jgi:hypothetical protein
MDPSQKKARTQRFDETNLWYTPATDGHERFKEQGQCCKGNEDNGGNQTHVLVLAGMYDANGDSKLEWAEWQQLVEDLLCLRDRVLYQPPLTKQTAARVIAEAIVSEKNGAIDIRKAPIDLIELINVAKDWDKFLSNPIVASQLGGKAQLCFLHDPLLVDRINVLRQMRKQQPNQKLKSAWAFSAPGSLSMHGHPVSAEMLNSENGWHFSDHGNGEGLVYFMESVKDVKWHVASLHSDSRGDDVRRHTNLHAIPVQKACGTSMDIPFISRTPSSDDNTGWINATMNGLSSTKIESPSINIYAVVDARLAALPQPLRAIECGAGGDCFFCVLSRALYAHESFHALCRSKTVQYMRKNPTDFEGFFDGEDFDAYCEQMGLAGTYIEGDMEIMAAANALNVNLKIWSFDDAHDRNIVTLKPSDETREVNLVHYAEPGAEHYKLAEPLV